MGRVDAATVIDEYKAEPRRGDFLVRGVIGVRPERGALGVGDRIEVRETIQLHVRDAATGDEDPGADLVLCYPVAALDPFSWVLGSVLAAAPSPAVER